VPREYHPTPLLFHRDYNHRRCENPANRLNVTMAVLRFCRKIQYKYAVRVEDPFRVLNKFALHHRASDSQLIVRINQHDVGPLSCGSHLRDVIGAVRVGHLQTFVIGRDEKMGPYCNNGGVNFDGGELRSSVSVGGSIWLVRHPPSQS